MKLGAGAWAALIFLTACGNVGAGSPARPGPAREPAAVTTPAKPDASEDEPGAEEGIELVAVDVFDIDPRTVERVESAYGDELRALMREDAAVDLHSLIERIREHGGYAHVEPALIGYFEGERTKHYLTIDVVTQDDAERRMPFSPSPTGTHADPDGLIAAWEAYEARAWELVRQGELSLQRTDCPAFHCLGDHDHPELKPLTRPLVTRVPDHVDELATILRDDHRVAYRAAAAYLLAYSTDGARAVELLLPAFRDESALVRNNAMRVIAEIAASHPGIDVPLDPILQALAYPSTTDRNKAAAILDALLERPDGARLHEVVIRRAGTTLLAMLRLEQPNNHDFAYEILRAVSGESFGERDYEAWEAWLNERQGGQRAAKTTH